MNGKNIAAIIIVLAIAVISGALLFQRMSKKEMATLPTSDSLVMSGTVISQNSVSSEQEPKGIVEVSMVKEGFSPSSITIPVGTTVKFINNDTVVHWPASGMHPTHQICQGFDSLKPIGPGQSYSFKFTVAKTCPMHDHLLPALRGSIVVAE